MSSTFQGVAVVAMVADGKLSLHSLYPVHSAGQGDGQPTSQAGGTRTRGYSMGQEVAWPQPACPGLGLGSSCPQAHPLL